MFDTPTLCPPITEEEESVVKAKVGLLITPQEGEQAVESLALKWERMPMSKGDVKEHFTAKDKRTGQTYIKAVMLIHCSYAVAAADFFNLNSICQQRKTLQGKREQRIYR